MKNKKLIIYIIFQSNRKKDKNTDDFTLSYLDRIVVSALEKSGAFAEIDSSPNETFKPYMPHKSWKLREKLENKKRVRE